MKEEVDYIKENLKDLYSSEEVKNFTKIILEDVLEIDSTRFFLCKDRPINAEQYDRIKNIVEQLKEFRPLQYIRAYTEFYGLEIKVDGNVLIPRPETEELTDWVIRTEKYRSGRAEKVRILDLCTGSGCIALALAKNLPNSDVSAVDNSENALVIAEENRKRNGAMVEYVEADILQALPEKLLTRRWDIIVSNPPYVLDSEKSFMSDNVLKYEPASAIFVEDTDPLKFYRKIGGMAHSLLATGGVLYFEINALLGAETRDLIQSMGFPKVELKKDLFGKDRFIRAER